MSKRTAWFGILGILLGKARKLAASRAPDFLIGGTADPYVERWWVIPRNRFFNIYLHHFRHSDDDRALHDHPWLNCSVLIDGSYTEHTHAGATQRHAGSIHFRAPSAAHRIELTHGDCWTIFLTGPVIREWGFLCPQGWRHWREFVSDRDRGSVGKGCA